MTLKDILNALDDFSHDELRELRDQIDQRQQQRATLALEQMPIGEWIARLEAAAAEIREGFTDEEWTEVERAMNGYVR